MSADDIMSYLVSYFEKYTVPKAIILANIQYMSRFIVYRPNNELEFLLTQLEAAVEYVHGRPEKHGKPLLKLPNQNQTSSHGGQDATEQSSVLGNDVMTLVVNTTESTRPKIHKPKPTKWGKFLERLQSNTADVVASSFKIA